MHAEILLPAGTTKVTVREIPYLLSKAIHPDVPETAEKIVSYLHKQNAENIAIPASRTEEHTDDEWAVLNAIWHHLPPFRQGMTESEWGKYAIAFDSAKHKPIWGLMVYWRNPATEAAILRIDTEEQHKKLLTDAILNGELTPYNDALIPCAHYAGEALLNAFITIEDFKNYLSRFPSINLKFEAAPLTMRNNVQLSKAAEPISPIRFNYSSKATENERLPRWGKWKLMPEVSLWKAVALSLNIEPDKIKYDRDADGDHPFDEGDTFSDRLEVLKKNFSDRTHFPTPCTLSMSSWLRHEIRLNEFAAWCVRIGYEIPIELAELAQGVQTSKPALDKEALPLQANLQKPWEVADPKDPSPAQPWYTPARYFARQLVKDDSTLLTKRNILAHKTSQSLASAGIYKRGGKLGFNATTILRALSNISLG